MDATNVNDDDRIPLDQARRLIAQMEAEAIQYNDAALVRRIKFWRKVVRDEERRQRGRR